MTTYSLSKSEIKERVKARYEIIQRYSDAGFALFRCGHPTDARAPKHAGWRDSIWRSDLDPTWFPEKCFGINLQQDDLVLDIDPRRFEKDKNGVKINQYKLLKAKLELVMPPTFVVKTGRGGLHVYLKKPFDVDVVSIAPGFPAIEIKSAGAYVVGAGSTHPLTNKPYKIIRGDMNKIAQCPPKLLEFLAKEGGGAVTTGSDVEDDSRETRNRFIKYCKAAPKAVSGQGGDIQTYKIACMGKDFGLSVNATYEIMRDYYNEDCQPKWEEEELETKVIYAFKYSKSKQGALHPDRHFDESDIAEINDDTALEGISSDDELAAEIIHGTKWDLDKNNERPIETFANIIRFFKIPDYKSHKNPLYKLIRYNAFAKRIEFNKRAAWHRKAHSEPFWTDDDTCGLKYFFSANKKLNFDTGTLREGVVVVARQDEYHPVVDYLRALRWDGKPRLDEWLCKFLSAPKTRIVRGIAKNFLIGAVARVLDPGCQMDNMLILEGDEGIGKTTVCRILGGEWTSDIPLDPKNKDTIQCMQGTWFMEVSELAFRNYANVETLKGFITRTTDKIRPSYGRFPVDMKRQTVFIGTYNPDATGKYLLDVPGNRRFWPVLTKRIDIEGLTNARDQLFAEAVARYDSGEPWWFTDEADIEETRLLQRSRVEKDAWEEIITEWIHDSEREETLPAIFHSFHVARNALNMAERNFGQIEKRRVDAILKGLGYVKTKKYSPEYGRQVRGWGKDVLD